MRNDAITIQAQTQRSRTANTDENHQKLVEELRRIYQERVPSATSDEKVKKHEAMYAYPSPERRGTLSGPINEADTASCYAEKRLSTIVGSR